MRGITSQKKVSERKERQKEKGKSESLVKILRRFFPENIKETISSANQMIKFFLLSEMKNL